MSVYVHLTEGVGISNRGKALFKHYLFNFDYTEGSKNRHVLEGADVDDL